MDRPLIINFVPTGMIPTKAMTPHVPISPSEIIEQTHEAYDLGITLAHLHARDEDGTPTYKTEHYMKIVEGVRKHCPDLVICLSMSGRNFNVLEKRSEVLELEVDMGSLTLSSLNFPQQASVNDPEMIRGLCMKLKETGTNPELEVFDLGMINYSNYLIKKGYIDGPLYYNIILGNIAGMQAEPSHVSTAIASLPEDSLWSMGGIGSAQLTANSLGISLGGGVRVGLEDNIFYDRKRANLATNLQLLQRIHDLAAIMERPVMSPRTFGDMGFYNKNRDA